MFFVYILMILPAVMCLYLFLLYPGKSRKERMGVFTHYYIAHRGLFDNSAQAPENTLSAFRKAVTEDFGIELDVQLTKDNRVIVIHDSDLIRTSGINKKIQDCTFEMLQEYRIFSSNEQVPGFSEVLSLINGTVPLIVELKSESLSDSKLCERVSQCLDTYNGPFCIESFNPVIVNWFRVHRPEYLRGFLSTDHAKNRAGSAPLPSSLQKLAGLSIRNFVLTNCLMNFLIRPDFIAYNIQYKNQLSYRICTGLFGIGKVGWTIQNEEELKTAELSFDVLIFDSFQP